VRQSVDGVDEVRLLAERVGAARSYADLERELDLGRQFSARRCVEVSLHRPGQEHGGRADARREAISK
jgi:hypothetical protein